MTIEQEIVVVNTTGSAGTATGSATSNAMNGWLEDIYFDFGAAPATTDTTVSFAIRGGNVVAIANSATDVLVAPRTKPVDNANAAITNGFEKFALNGPLTISLAQCDALTPALTAYIRYVRP